MNRERNRGVALLLVLWLVALLVATVGAFALSARTEQLQGQVLARGLQSREAARAGLEHAVSRLMQADPQRRWVPDGREYKWRFGDADIAVRIVDEQGKVDLDMADANLLAALLRQLGSDPQQAMRVAGAIVDWRDADTLTQPSGGAEAPDYAAAGRDYGPANMPFESVAEVEQVLGMTPALYARLAPLVTVYSGRAMPDPAYAPGQVRAAMGVPAAAPDLVAGNSGTYSIESRASVRGRAAVLRVVARAGGNGLPGSAWTPLRWEEGASPR
ncbi:MAG TPA: type II secretion system minor pseudopilin GspK [Luteimonas sp.]|nr:type II secretion system minor pseudopilin GspK [Luteimonas sp.]